MNANTHTPAPWASDNTRKYYDAWLIRHNGIAVARMMQDTTRTKEEHEANAQLIAAAPELLAFASLVARMKTEDEMGENSPASEDWIATLNELIASARAVVAKASGATRETP